MEQETLEEAAVDYISEKSERAREYGMVFNAIRFGAKWQAERMYSEEEVYDILVEHTIELFKKESKTLNEWFEQFKKK
jgi:hypothetical protein